MSASFTIHGETITQLARERVLEDWSAAVVFLQQSLGGITYEQCVEILSGNAKLTGKSPEVFMEDDDDAGTKEAQRYRWRLYATKGRKTWKATVAHWVVELSYLRRGEGVAELLKEKYPGDGPAEYATVTTGTAEGDYVVVFSRVEGPTPPWLTLSSMGQAARSFPEPEPYRQQRGVFSAETYKEIDDLDSEPYGTASLLADAAAQMGLSPAQVSELAESLDPSPEDAGPPKTCNPEELDYGYIDPQGRCYACAWMAHKRLSSRMFPDSEDPEKTADAAGWLKITEAIDGGGIRAIIEGRITEPQREKWEEWCAWHHARPDILVEL